jgi:type III secretion protein L
MSHLRSRKELADAVETTNAPNISQSLPRPEGPPRLSSLLVRLPQLPSARKGVRIVRAEDNADLFDAEGALAAAQTETKRLKLEVETAVNQGREEGYAAGLEQANTELATEIHRIHQHMAAWQSEARETIVDLAVKITTKLVGTVDLEDITRTNIINQTFKHVNDGPYALQVAPDMLPLARRALRDLETQHPGVATPALRLDARLPEGRAVLVTRYGSIDLDLNTQLEAIRASLLGQGGEAEPITYS